MQHNAPHQGAAFEGYYNKFDLPSGAQIVLVISKVNKATSNPNALSFLYIPEDPKKIWERQVFVDSLEMRRLKDTDNAFTLDLPGIGHVTWNEDGATEYDLQREDFTLKATTTSRTPWSQTTDTPEGPFVNLPLPLHWHVQSLASKCKFELSISDYDLPAEDTAGEAVIHQEKNWAHAFPSAHMWLQARSGERGLCGAGGKILGIDAFLLGYRSLDLNLDFRPPFAVRMLGWSPFLSYIPNWDERTFELTLRNWSHKIEIKASAPIGSFYSLNPPFAEGHRENYLGQSLCARIEVKIHEKPGWFGPWRLVREDAFERAGLEFGAGFYPPAGTEVRFN